MASRAALLLSLLASTTCAQVTTSYLLPNSTYGTNRLRFVASVINATNEQVTLVAELDHPEQYSALGGFGAATWTLGSTFVEASTSELIHRPTRTFDAADANAYSYRCDIPTSAATADCTVSRGPSLIAYQCRTGTPSFTFTEKIQTDLWTYSQDGEVGTETIVRTFPGQATTTRARPEWCPKETDMTKSDLEPISVPESARIETFTQPRSNFGLYRFVITAGEEKLPKATTGATVSSESVTPTGTGSQEPAETSSQVSNFGGAAPMKTMAPALAGLGAAVAMFL